MNSISKLKRCTKCVLPETFPYIEYDDEGVCNYCRNHKPSNASKSLDDFKKVILPYRKDKGQYDCIVPFSGGRDSTYTLHLVKKELELNPIAFTYDWGVATDLAYRNMQKVCDKLNVRNVIIKADIHKKRLNIRKNIVAWLKRPELGMIPLFMTGDKFFFYYCNKIKREYKIDLNIWGVNDLENTNFKTGFEGIKPNFEKETIYSLTTNEKIKLFKYVTKNVLLNPSYINSSMIDSLGSFISRYVTPKKDYFHIFDYYQWNETEINNLIVNEYQWEMATDSVSTWRIGDGTAAFYNYIYYTIAGFSEYDTFRSNQIREGMIDRDTALKLLDLENQPRYDSIKWYLDLLNLNYEDVMRGIDNIPKLYK